jgi:serine/threonine protein kinase
MNAADLERARIGRFTLMRALGKGARATVWLAHDERLDREVALKLLDPQADASTVQRWLHEARAVSRLAHPNIVPVFEADELRGQFYLVFEFVEGSTLAQVLRSRGAIPPHEAVHMMLGVLDALATAHAQGIVHRDLKPSNILVGGDRRARVMDFGIAARVAAGGDGCVVGTPGYMSPEAACGEAPTPAMDVFAAGLVLAEMLAGHSLMHESDAAVALQRMQREDLLLPAALQVDEQLRSIVQRALARAPGERYAEAVTMRRALAQWARPAGAATTETSGTLEFLLRRMKQKTDFPALSSSVLRIQRIAQSDRESLGTLAGEILKDVALTNKLLRMVNSAHFSQAAGGGVSTVSRAVALVGFAGIRNMALSALLLEHLKDKAQAQLLTTEFLRSLTAAHLAGELAVTEREAEEAFLGAMLQYLGRLVAEFYLPQEAQQIRALVKPEGGSGALAASCDEPTASLRVLGLSYEDLGQGVAKAWGLPDSLRQAMRRPAGEPPARALARGAEHLRWIARAANDMADVLLDCEPGQAEGRIAAVAKHHARALGWTAEHVSHAAATARSKVTQIVEALAIELVPSSPARRLLAGDRAAPAQASDALAGLALQATRPAEERGAVADEPALAALGRQREEVSQMLTAGIQDITNTMVADAFRLDEVLRMVLETMYRALHFRRVVFCLRDPKTEMLVGRFGLGERASEVAALFRVPLRLAPGARPDLFRAVCLKAADTLISDARTDAIAGCLPPWHREKVGAPAFLLLPLSMKGAPFGLIYADKATAGAIDLDERELNLLRTLRNQAVLAFRQAA